MTSVIKIENLWKEYRLGVIGHGTLTHDLQSWWAKVRSKEDPNSKIAPMLAGQEKQIDGDHFWALRDINLEVKQGEILGIIGKNGAGKSTLLKILSRVTAPSRGNINIKGRIASLLEVGTGFHPELTGLENIFMNGAILGMSKQEIKSKLSEIINFSGVESFIDTPVKRYSSGMYVRLAFAVAAHLEPEILIIDEVLAVGDAEFQEKCLGKMGEVSREGRTVLFVSHNLGSVRKLCSRGILLDNGKVDFTGNVSECIDSYLAKGLERKHFIQKNREKLTTENQFVSLFNSDIKGEVKNEFKHDDEVAISVEVYLPNWNDKLELSFSLYCKHKRRIFTIDVALKEYYTGNPIVKFVLTLHSPLLTVGKYSWLTCINLPGVRSFDLQDDVCSFVVLETGSDFMKYTGLDYGVIFPPKHTVKVI